ncbi:hypothetical protein DFJ74DRAFT_681940 [Hyaloraphidium curvatum]|nr:hypothetical protein DFJ74DRAFT_681940 [Hyaloraphidium curvatum]
MPESWSFAEGAAFPVQAVTAYYGLFRLGAATKGSSVLVHSAAGGTGLWATKLCLAAGASVVGTVGSAGKAAELQRLAGLPADCIVDRSTAPSASREAALRAAAEAACGRPTFDVVFDSLLGEWFAPSYALLAPMGRHVVLGAGAMTPPDAGLGMLDWLRLGYQYLTRPTVDPLAMMSLNRSVMAFNLIWLYEAADLLGEVFAELAEATKELGPAHVGAEFAFEDAPAALRKLQGGETVGKVVLIVGDHGGGA